MSWKIIILNKTFSLLFGAHFLIHAWLLKNIEILLRGPNLFFKYFYFLFGPGLFYPLRVIATVQIFFGTLVGPLTLLHPKMKLLRCREPRELETFVFLYFTWFYDYEIRVQSTCRNSILFYSILFYSILIYSILSCRWCRTKPDSFSHGWVGELHLFEIPSSTSRW